MGLIYFDSSAIVKRYVNEPGTAWVNSLIDPMAGNLIYLARITAVEVVSAITRHNRSRVITPSDAATALLQFRRELASLYKVLEITAGLVSRAMLLVETHTLRGYDAVQLAAALEINDECSALGLPHITLISSDASLNDAAIAEGLIVDDPNSHP